MKIEVHASQFVHFNYGKLDRRELKSGYANTKLKEVTVLTNQSTPHHHIQRDGEVEPMLRIKVHSQMQLHSHKGLRN
jgi:hypothetical protein